MLSSPPSLSPCTNQQGRQRWGDEPFGETAQVQIPALPLPSCGFREIRFLTYKMEIPYRLLGYF